MTTKPPDIWANLPPAFAGVIEEDDCDGTYYAQIYHKQNMDACLTGFAYRKEQEAIDSVPTLISQLEELATVFAMDAPEFHPFQDLIQQIGTALESAHSREIINARPHLELALATLLCKEPA
jgi:bifunctional DNase/RNase